MMVPPSARPADDPRSGPLVLRRDLLATGHNDRAIGRLVRDGTLVRVRDGAFVPPVVWEQLDEVGRYGLRCRAVLAQSKTRLALSHVSALPEVDVPVWGFDLDDVHTTRLDGHRGRCAPGIRQHVGTVRENDVVEVNGVTAMHPARAALETITLGSSEASFCVLNDVLHRGLATEAELNEQHVAMQTWPGMLPAEILLRLADGRIESVGESRTFWTLHQQRVPLPVPQYEVQDSNGRVVARLDFAWPELGVWLEFDGKVKYEKLLKEGERPSDVVVREKAREDLVRRITGWRCIRITWADLQDPRRLAALVRSYLTPSAA